MDVAMQLSMVDVLRWDKDIGSSAPSQQPAALPLGHCRKTPSAIADELTCVLSHCDMYQIQLFLRYFTYWSYLISGSYPKQIS
jgi:hypothetical protein